MRSRGWLCPIMLLALAPAALRGEGPDRTQWKLGTFTWIKRVPAEPGAPLNAQPASLSPADLQTLLAPVQGRDEGKDLPLFGKGDLKELAPALSEALALAQPGEDLLLLSTSRHDAGFLERATGITARLFVRDGALNLIVHDARLDFLDRYILDNLQPTFVYGTRQTASAAQLKAPQATLLRGDWLALPLPAAPAHALAPAPPPAPPVAAAQVPAPPVAPAARDAAYYEAQAQRLKALKRLRDENLLSENEYQEKREAILKAL